MPTGDPMCSSCGNYINMCNCQRVPIHGRPFVPHYSFTSNPEVVNQELKNRVIELENKVIELTKRVEFLEKGKSQKKNFGMVKKNHGVIKKNGG